MLNAPLATFEQIRYECSDEILCAHCHSPLDRHQPVDASPDRLLGTCCDCGAWFIIDDHARVMVPLPDIWSKSQA